MIVTKSEKAFERLKLSVSLSLYKKKFKFTGTCYTRRCENIISVAMEIFEFAFYGLLWTDLKLHTAIANCCSLSWCSFWQALEKPYGIGCTLLAAIVCT